MSSVFKKSLKKKTSIGFIVLILIFIAGCMNKVLINNGDRAVNVTKNEENAIKTSERFVEYLFSADEDVLLATTGDVRRSLEKNIDEIKEYKLINIDSSVESANDKFATVHIKTEYIVQHDVEVSFYRFYLIKENNEYLIYRLEENMDYSDINLASNDNINEVDENVFKIIEGYIDELDNGMLSKSGGYLIGKARYNHNISYDFVVQAKDQIKFDIGKIDHEVIVNATNGICMVKSSYINNGNKVEIISSLYHTSRGWRIYDITQI